MLTSTQWKDPPGSLFWTVGRPPSGRNLVFGGGRLYLSGGSSIWKGIGSWESCAASGGQSFFPPVTGSIPNGALVLANQGHQEHHQPRPGFQQVPFMILSNEQKLLLYTVDPLTFHPPP